MRTKRDSGIGQWGIGRTQFGVQASISALLGSGAIAAPAYAQEALEEVVVTGSRIARRDFEANSPIMTVDASRFEESSTIAIESVMNQLPQFVPAITQFSPGSTYQGSQATPGASTVSLRGLGSNRNLVLLDGRRAMPINASMAVSINTIPRAAVARIETITGGASSVYGADAIAGVVNFVLKRDFEGIDLSAQVGDSQHGGSKESSISGLIGGNFGRGNIMLGVEVSEREEMRRKQRDFYTDGWADPTSNTGTTFYHPPGYTVDLRNRPSQAAVNQVFAGGPRVPTLTGSFYQNPDGTLHKDTIDGAWRYNGPFTDDEGYTTRYVDSTNGTLRVQEHQTQAQSPLERVSLFGSARFDVSDNISAFANVIMSDSQTNTISSPPLMTGGWRTSVPHGNGTYAPSVDALGNTLPDYLSGGRFGLNCPTTGGCTKSQAWPMPPEMNVLLDSRANPEADVDLRNVAGNWYPLLRQSFIDTTSYQIVAGLEGSLPTKDWTWEAFVSHGSTDTLGIYTGMMSLERYRFVTRQPNYGTGMFYTGNALGEQFAAGAASCTSGIPVVWGAGYAPTSQITADCVEAIRALPKMTGDMEQQVAEVNLQGGIIDLPAGELRFAAGLSRRVNSFEYYVDSLNFRGSILDQVAGAHPLGDAVGDTSVAEIYGELLVPLLHDKPLIQALSLELGYRDSDNEPSNDTASYKALLDWRFTDRVRLRGGRQIANRAPNIGELFQSSEEVVFNSPLGDWCSDLNPGNALSPNPLLNPNAAQARAICEARMGPIAAEVFYSNPDRNREATQWRFPGLIGNPNVKSEEAETITFGVIADIAENVRLSVDYWNIRIDDMIAAQTADGLAETCLNPATNPTFDPNHPACAGIERDPNDGDSAKGMVTFTNQGAVDSAGVDLQLDWNGDIGPGMLSLNFLATISNKVKTRLNPTAPWRDWVGTAGPNDLSGLNTYSYDYRTFSTLTYDVGDWTSTLRWRFLPSIESDIVVANPLGARNTGVQPTNSYNMFDFAGRYAFRTNAELRYGIDNVFDKQPEITFPEALRSQAGNTNPNFYDILGRRFYLGLNWRL